jgi:peroxin-6
LLAVRSDYSKLLAETAGLHSTIPYLPSITADALQHLSGSNGIFLFIQDWDLVAQQATVDSHDTAVVSANSAAQMPIHQKSLQDIVCASLLELQHNILVSYQEKKSSVEQSMNTSVKDLVIIVAVTSSSSSWLSMWRQLHSPCRQAFPVLWTPFEPPDMHSSTVDMNSTSPGNCEKYQETESPVQFSVGALRYLSLVILGDDIHISQNKEKLKNSSVGALAVRESLERNFGWDYLREILPITDESTVTVQNWHRLLHGAHLDESFCTDKYINVTIKDVQRAYCKLFPLQPLPSWHNADSSLSQKQARKSSHKTKNKHIEPVYWEDIGGLERVRQEILDVLELPFHYPELFPPHAPRRQGVLLYGPPGTGKTLVAKAVATECHMAFLSVKGPELLDAYVGESEKNVRDLFVKARQLAPCVLFFDEIDSLAPARAKRNDSGGGVTDRIVSQLLTEIDQLVTATSTSTGEAFNSLIKSESTSVRTSADSNNANNPKNSEHVSAVTPASVFVIAATNRPDLLDPALLRPGRFDRKIYLGVCSDVSARQSILQAQTRKFQLASDVDFAYIATHCLPKNVTGADLGAVSSSAFSSALERKLHELETLRLTQYGSSSQSSEEELDFLEAFSDDKLQVIVTQQDFIAAARSLVPSVVDLSYYEELHATYDSSLPDSETIH